MTAVTFDLQLKGKIEVTYSEGQVKEQSCEVMYGFSWPSILVEIATLESLSIII